MGVPCGVVGESVGECSMGRWPGGPGNLVGACGCCSCIRVSLLGGLRVWGLWPWVSGVSMGLRSSLW